MKYFAKSLAAISFVWAVSACAPVDIYVPPDRSDLAEKSCPSHQRVKYLDWSYWHGASEEDWARVERFVKTTIRMETGQVKPRNARVVCHYSFTKESRDTTPDYSFRRDILLEKDLPGHIWDRKIRNRNDREFAVYTCARGDGPQCSWVEVSN